MPPFKKNDKFQRGRNYKKAGGSANSGSYQGADSDRPRWSDADKQAYAKKKRVEAAALDARFGYEPLLEGPPRLGWLFNMVGTVIEEGSVELAAVDLYFVEQDASTFKATYVYEPYFYVGVADARFCGDVASMLQRRFESTSPPLPLGVEVVDKEDLELANHLAGHQRKYLKLKFNNVSDMMNARKELQPIVASNQAQREKGGAYGSSSSGGHGAGVGGGFLNRSKGGSSSSSAGPEDVLELLSDLREYDVTFSMRASIDLDLRCGTWYVVHPPVGGDGEGAPPAAAASLKMDDDDDGSSSSPHVRKAGLHARSCSLEWKPDLMVKAEPRVLAFDIECTKEPLKFPQADRDQIFMISYMVDTQGYLIISRSVVGEDIADFEYTPKPGMEGPFQVFNEVNEEALLRRFFAHVQEVRPQIFVTYNGDFFDWPFIEKRAHACGLDMATEIGVAEAKDGGYRGACSVHLDCMAWVNRDSYLPQGSRSLKAVAREKLGYDPVEVDPEDMVKFAMERPKHMAGYSVSDAVATFYLYSKYIHDFIFALCTIIPLGPEDVLNKGSGTLCESLLMIEAYRKNIICPNKQVDPLTSFHEGHLLESETYVGGHVEALETGVYRSDLEYAFNVDPATVQKLIDSVDLDLAFALEVENGIDRSHVANYEEVRSSIVESLEQLRDEPKRMERPLIYHLDVAAMYPNIILTNRLQPSSMKKKEDCAACDFNVEGNQCKRPMEWVWRGDFLPASLSEYQSIKTQLMYENVKKDSGTIAFGELSAGEQAAAVKKRLKGYSLKVYKSSKKTVSEKKVDTVCMREDPFYVDTVRNFRDRRYEFKKLTKTWKKSKEKAKGSGDAIGARSAGDKETLYDSLQLAHKCILNSFYGYVMRRGARWRSMEMAGIVTDTGAALIKQARELVENLGRPLELDTDGIWCILPKSFPENYTFMTHKGESVGISYPCVMLNAQVHDTFTNHQYQDLNDPARRKWAMKSECSIFFEVDGPYRAMVLPASTEEGKLLKKRYAVFEDDGSLAELKGFELKRRGELELVKGFQEQVFSQFLLGSTLVECYSAVGAIADNWLDLLETRGAEVDDDELLELISENKTISGLVSDYGAQKITSLTTAARLADYLGGEMLLDKGLNCRLVIANRPFGAPVTDRAIPTLIFKAEKAVQTFWLKKWLKTNANVELRDVIDWQYYNERLGKTIAKIITIPAALQGIPNPVPRVVHPDWLQRKVRQDNLRHQQRQISSVFKKLAPGEVYQPFGGPAISPTTTAASSNNQGVTPEGVGDMEDFGSSSGSAGSGGNNRTIARVARKPLLMNQQGTAAAASSTSSDANAAQAAPVPCPDRSEDPDGWLAHRKASWRALRARLKQEKQAMARRGGGSSSSSLASTSSVGGSSDLTLEGPKRGLGVGDLVANASKQISHGTWQVVEVYNSGAPGEFVVWALTSAKTLQRIPIEVSKTLFLNSKVDQSDALQSLTKHFGARRVTHWALPRAKPVHHLYELNVPERRYQRNRKLLQSLASDQSVEGVYETSTPALFRTVLRLGCTASLGGARRSAESDLASRRARLTLRQRQRALENGGAAGSAVSDLPPLNLADLVTISNQANAVPGGYLSPNAAAFKRIFLYHSTAETGLEGRATTALFFLDGLNDLDPNEPPKLDENGLQIIPAARVAIWFTNPVRQQEQRPPFKKLARELLAANYPWLSSATGLEFSVAFVKKASDAWELAGKALRAYSTERHGPTMVLAQTPWSQSPASLRKACPSLSADFAVVPLPFDRSDLRYASMQWPVECAKTLLQRYFDMPEKYLVRVAASRYACVPLANLGDDPTISTVDALLGRLLSHNRQVLWASESGVPDLGGSECDDHHVQSGGGLGDLNSANNVPVVVPGAYRSVCIEIEVLNLCVDAIAASATLDELDGTQGLGAMEITTHSNNKGGTGTNSSNSAQGFFGASDNNDNGNEGAGAMEASSAAAASSSAAVGDGAACAPAFRVLKALVQRWLMDASGGSTQADSLLSSLPRYLASRNALLHDPALFRVVQQLMEKVFLRLVSELRRLGAHVVYGDFGRLIIATDKQDPRAAQEYVKFVLDTLMAHPVFEFLHVEPTKYYSSLLFLDEHNYTALQVNESSLEGGGEAEGTDEALSSLDASSMPTDLVQTPKPKRSRQNNAEEAAVEAAVAGEDDEQDEQDDARDEDDEDIEVDDDDDEIAVVSQRRKKKGSAPVRNSQILDSDSDDDDDEDESSKHPRGGSETGGSEAGSYNGDEQDEAGEGGNFDDNEGVAGGPLFDSRWDIAEYLPDAIREYFMIAVVSFLYKPWERQQQLESARMEKVAALAAKQLPGMSQRDSYGSAGASPNNLSALLATPARGENERGGRDSLLSPLSQQNVSKAIGQVEDDDEEAMQAFLSIHITKNMTHLLLRAVGEMNDYRHKYDFPIRAGSWRSDLTNPALEFVKTVCRVLSLDATVADSVQTLRRTLLVQCGVREFASEAIFESPGVSFVLPDVTCTLCNHAQDLDLCRDPRLNLPNPNDRWKCSNCDALHDKDTVELRLVENLQKRSTAFQLQDLRCQKCHRVAKKQMGLYCPCSGNLACDDTPEAFAKYLRTLTNIAKFHSFDWLREVAESLAR